MTSDLPNPLPLDDSPDFDPILAEPTARERAAAVLQQGEAVVRENPWPALGLAFGFGLVVGLTLFRERREPTLLETAQDSLGRALHGASDRIVSLKDHAMAVKPADVTTPIADFFRKLAA